MSGEIYVGRREYRGSSYQNFQKENTIPIFCLTASTEYGCLSPYQLKDENGLLMENIWQFGKIYPAVPAVQIPYSRWDKRIIWQYPAEQHIENDTILPVYWNWRVTGMKNSYPVRYPVGYNYRHNCVGFLQILGNEMKLLNYIQARKEIYIPLYRHCIDIASEESHAKKKYREILNMLREGKSITIIEVDGPKSSLLSHYQEKYGVKDNFIVDNVMLATTENLEIMKRDDKSPYGHGYCLAECLLADL